MLWCLVVVTTLLKVMIPIVTLAVSSMFTLEREHHV